MGWGRLACGLGAVWVGAVRVGAVQVEAVLVGTVQEKSGGGPGGGQNFALFFPLPTLLLLCVRNFRSSGAGSPG